MRDAPGSEQALTPAQGALATLSAAIAGADAGTVEREIVAAADSGVSPSALYESILQSYLFVGFPRAIEALIVARPVLERLGAIPKSAAPVDPRAWERDGETLCRSVYGRNYEKLLETMRSLSPDLASSMILEGYGKTLSRPALGALEREYCVIAILTVTRMWRQLRSHAIGAVNVGGTRAGVRDAIGRAAPWAGGSAAAEALRVAGLEPNHAGR